MGIGGHKLGLKFYGRVTELRNRLSRARFFRGHGVHSPFVYDVVRHVFMRDTLLPGDRRCSVNCLRPECPNAAPYSCKTWRFIAATPLLA